MTQKIRLDKNVKLEKFTDCFKKPPLQTRSRTTLTIIYESISESSYFSKVGFSLSNNKFLDVSS